MKFGLIKERKSPPDRRVVFSPSELVEVVKRFPEVEFVVETSDIRVFSDQEYRDLGFEVSDDLSDCDVLLGVKEVPIDALIPNKTYFFFSHTIKKQSYNRALLQACLDKNIRLIDHETLVDENDKRLIGFGRYAGIVGAYNAFRAFGIKFELFNLVKAEVLLHTEDLISRLNRPYLPPVKVVLTGHGKVGMGAKEILDGMKMKPVSIDDFLNKTFDVPVYTQIDVMDYYKRIDGTEASKADFYKNPELYDSNFERFTREADIFIAGHFYKTGSPKILTKEMLNGAHNQIKVVADISCDVAGPIDSTLRASTIADPIYGYYPRENKEVSIEHPAAVVVMAVDNLPCELPKDASEGFGETFIDQVMPAFFNNDKDGVFQRACVTANGKLTERFKYLEDFLAE
ncbi:NAD(P)-dependent oxidoreductase [Flavobacterium sp. NKUCC04_CG]|uniref:NAD(P)-dependent oxidoreductase n=1 Tax=Flavobacterium sp. NKUCC04_CG TaxID=2842121 RepID=UPI001C5B392A|nr:NAD(P)-dependent oxidoreductase [Flavobacterium sp. NKUCC04_CG]MBW3518676.1 NAD(P)-dependent oxidoreductase [Flavobacterium sp. NKUCC04_CG]